jgi:hypothetical protein
MEVCNSGVFLPAPHAVDVPTLEETAGSKGIQKGVLNGLTL